MSSPPPPAPPPSAVAREPDPHAAHSDYSTDYASVRRQEPLAVPRPGRGRPRKINPNANATSQALRQQASAGAILKRVPPRSSLAPPAASLSDLPGAPALVYKCPITGCERIFATKLALKRHFQVYQHEAIFDGPLESVLVVNPPPMSSEGSDELMSATNAALPKSASPLAKVLPKLYKCPVLQCLERFPTENELAAHWRYMHPTLKGSLGEWSNLLYEFDGISLTPVEHPATYLKEIEANPDANEIWQFHSIFQVLGPQPALKVAQVVAQVRHHLAAAFMAQTSTIVVDESMMGLLIQLALHELMPKGFLLTRDADPMRMASSSSYDVWADEPWLRAIEAESAQTLLHFGSAHTSRAFKRRVPTEGDEGIAEAAPPVEDRFVCQVPGCAKVFASLPAYKYHMHHYEHDFEILLRCSRLLRRVFFAPLVPGEDLAPAAGPGAFLPERWVLRFSERQDLNRFQEGGGGGEAQFGRARRHICDRIMCLPDVVHILHGYIDQQLPLLFSFHFTKKRGAISLTSPSADFSITMRRDEDTVTLKRELVEMLTERRTRDVRRKPPPTTRTEDLGESSFGVSSFRDADAAFYQMSPRTISPADGSFALGGEGEIDASQRSHISLLCKFVVPAQLDRFQARRFVAAIGGIPPGKTATTTQPLAISPVPGGMPAAGSSSLTSLRPLPCAAMQPVQLRVLGLAPCSSEASTLSPDSKLVTPAPEVVASSEMIPLSGLHLSATDAVAYGDGFPLTSVDFFPGMAWQGEYGITWIAVGGNGAPTVSKFTVYLWALFLCFDSMAMGYRIASAPVLINAVSLGSGVDADDGRESSSEDLTDSDDGRGTVVAVKWCPFLFTTGATTAPAMGTMLASQDTRALMAVLDAVGAIFVFCLGMRSMLILVDTAVALMEEGGALPTPGTSDSGNLLTQAPLCRLAIPSYAITCFSWCKIPGQPLRIVAGTREGYIALFDLSSLREPVLVLMSPGHPTLISAIDWSMSDPNKVITASFDNTVVLWLLDNMYARTTLLQSRLPFLNASWMHSAHQAVGYQEKETPTGSLAWDPVGAVIAVDESNLAKIVLFPEPGRVITLASSTPRMWVGVYPNSRFGGTLLAMANWNGKVELFGTPDPRSKKGDSSNIASWSYNRETRAFSVYLPPVADDDIIASSVGMNDPMEWVQVSWHPIPIGLFAVVAATGLVHIHCS